MSADAVIPKEKLASAPKWVDPNDAPRLGRDWFKRAEIRDGERLIRKARLRGRGRARITLRP